MYMFPCDAEMKGRENHCGEKPGYIKQGEINYVGGRYHETECYDDYLNYKNAMNRTRKLIRQAKMKYEEKIVGKVKEDPKAYYRYASSKLKSKENVGLRRRKWQLSI